MLCTSFLYSFLNKTTKKRTKKAFSNVSFFFLFKLIKLINTKKAIYLFSLKRIFFFSSSEIATWAHRLVIDWLIDWWFHSNCLSSFDWRKRKVHWWMNVERIAFGIDVSSLKFNQRNDWFFSLAVPLMAITTTFMTYRRLNSKNFNQIQEKKHVYTFRSKFHTEILRSKTSCLSIYW